MPARCSRLYENICCSYGILETSICIRCIMYTYTKHHVLTNCYKMSGRVQEETCKEKSFHVQLSEFKLSNNSVGRKLVLFG